MVLGPVRRHPLMIKSRSLALPLTLIAITWLGVLQTITLHGTTIDIVLEGTTPYSQFFFCPPVGSLPLGLALLDGNTLRRVAPGNTLNHTLPPHHWFLPGSDGDFYHLIYEKPGSRGDWVADRHHISGRWISSRDVPPGGTLLDGRDDGGGNLWLLRDDGHRVTIDRISNGEPERWDTLIPTGAMARNKLFVETSPPLFVMEHHGRLFFQEVPPDVGPLIPPNGGASVSYPHATLLPPLLYFQRLALVWRNRDTLLKAGGTWLATPEGDLLVAKSKTSVILFSPGGSRRLTSPRGRLPLAVIASHREGLWLLTRDNESRARWPKLWLAFYDFERGGVDAEFSLPFQYPEIPDFRVRGEYLVLGDQRGWVWLRINSTR